MQELLDQVANIILTNIVHQDRNKEHNESGILPPNGSCERKDENIQNNHHLKKSQHLDDHLNEYIQEKLEEYVSKFYSETNIRNESSMNITNIS